MPKCFKCLKQLSTVKDLCRHLRQVHLLTEPAPISCAEGGCCRTFTRYNSLHRHILICHRQSETLCINEQSLSYVCDAASVSHVTAVDCEIDENTDVNGTEQASPGVDEITNNAAHFLLSLTASSSVTLSQVQFMKDITSSLVTSTIDIVGTGSETVVIAHKEFVSLFPESTDTLRDAFLANSVTVYGTRYEPGYTVIMDVDSEGYPVLGYIVKILVCEGLVSFAVQKWIIDRFDGMTRSYMCLLSHSKVACHQRSLFDFHLLFAHQCLDEACGYYHVRLRHMLCSDC